MQASDVKDSNPYVAVVAKKHRNLKKKLERIAKAEQLLAQGKVLDEEQRVLLSSKKAIEKSVAELLNIKQQLEEVAKLEESSKKDGSPASNIEATPEEKEEVEAPAQDATTFTESAEQIAAATMTEVEEPFEEPVVPEIDLKEAFNQFIERLIKALHVYERYTHVTSQPLPDTVMYFGRTLLGLTSISSFQDTLNNSIRVAGFYLHDDLAHSNDVIRGTSYAKLASEIDVLVEEMERVQQRGSTNALTALLRTTIAPVSPTNTPAAVETVPTYESGLYGSLQFGEQPLGSFNQYQYTAPAPAPVYQATEAVYQAPVTETQRTTVPIAPTLPEFEQVVEEEPQVEEVVQEEPVEEEEAHFEHESAPVVEEPAVESVVAAEPEAVVHVEEDATKTRFSKNVRVRGDPSRAARKAEDATKHASRGASHHNEPAAVHQAPAQKTFRDRLLSGKAEVAVAAPAPAAAPEAPAAPVVEVAAATEDSADKKKRTPRSGKKDNAAPTPAETEAAPASAEKPKRDRASRTRTRRSEAEPAAESAPSKASKKWSAIAAAPTGDAAAPTVPEATEKKPKTDRAPRASGDKPPRVSSSAPRGNVAK